MKAIRPKTKPRAEIMAGQSILQGAREASAFAWGGRDGYTVHVEKPTFVCNLLAIGATERPRYKELVKRVREAMYQREEIASGYRFRLDGAAVTLIETGMDEYGAALLSIFNTADCRVGQ